MHIKSLMNALILTLLCNSAFAANNDDVFTLTLNNLSQQTLHFETSWAYPGSNCSLSDNTIAAGQTVTVKGVYTSGESQGLGCQYLFDTDHGQAVTLNIIDPIAIYQGTGTYQITGLNYSAHLTPNVIDPNAILDKAANITIDDTSAQ